MHHPESSLRKLLTNVTQRLPMACTAPPLYPGPESCEPSPTNASLPPLEIRETSDIAPELEAIGVSPMIARQISDAYLRAAHDLRDAGQTSFKKALQKASARGVVTREDVRKINEVLNAAHAEQTSVWAQNAFSRARQLVAKAKAMETAKQPAKEKKPVFNHEYTPLLEKYFEYNAYPSAPDRAVLARKSMMTPRQIEVWFQNHRNRARKDGKPLRRLAEDPLPLEISLRSLERKMPFFTIPEHERRPLDKSQPLTDDSSDEEKMPSMSARPRIPVGADALDPPRPRHAFPTMYPPKCEYTPFPTDGPYRFPPVVWFRKPGTTSRTVKCPVDMDDFIAEFNAKLHLRAPVTAKGRSKPAHSWCASRATVPLPAPLPAFVRSPRSPSASCTSRLRAVPAPLSRLQPFPYPGPFAQPATLLPAQQSDSIPSRKVARLPRRTPKSSSIAHCRGSPTISEASPTPSRSSSSASRSSSFGSEMSSERRPSSSSGSSSSSSSALPTPVLSPSELPDVGHSASITVSGLDFENIDGLVSVRGDTFPPREGSPVNFSAPSSPKQATAFVFSSSSAGALGVRHSPIRSHAPPS